MVPIIVPGTELENVNSKLPNILILTVSIKMFGNSWGKLYIKL